MTLRNNKCIVLDLKEKGKFPYGKHEAHPPHDWWYTSYGGGHQLHEGWVPDKWVSPDRQSGVDSTEGWVYQWRCPGRD